MLPGPGDSLTLQAGEGGEEGLREGQGELTWKPSPSISPQQAQMLTKNLFLLGRRLMLMGGTNPWVSA